jgi:hypothetical protein
MDDATLKRLRPADTSLSAISAAQSALAGEEEKARERLLELQNSRISLLLNGTTAEIRAAEDETRNAEIELLQLGALADVLKDQRAEAERAAMAEQHERLAAEADAAAEKFNAFLQTRYPKAAGVIAEGCELERRAWTLRERLRGNGGVIRGSARAIDAAHVGGTAKSLGSLVRLPAHSAGLPPPWWPDMASPHAQ